MKGASYKTSGFSYPPGSNDDQAMLLLILPFPYFQNAKLRYKGVSQRLIYTFPDFQIFIFPEYQVNINVSKQIFICIFPDFHISAFPEYQVNINVSLKLICIFPDFLIFRSPS